MVGLGCRCHASQHRQQAEHVGAQQQTREKPAAPSRQGEMGHERTGGRGLAVSGGAGAVQGAGGRLGRSTTTGARPAAPPRPSGATWQAGGAGGGGGGGPAARAARRSRGPPKRGCSLQHLPRRCTARSAAGQAHLRGARVPGLWRCAKGACRPPAHAPNEFADCPWRGGARRAALGAPLSPLSLHSRSGLPAPLRLSGRVACDCPHHPGGVPIPAGGRRHGALGLHQHGLSKHWPLANDRERACSRNNTVGAPQARQPAPGGE